MDVAALIIAAGQPGSSFEIDPGTASVIGSVLVLAGVIFNVSRADNRAKTEVGERPDPEPMPTESHPGPGPDRDWVQYVREEVAKEVERATKDLRDQVERLTSQVQGMGGKLSRIRRAFRDYVRQSHDTWGVADHPPPLTDEIRQLLIEDDLEGTMPHYEVRAAAHQNEPEQEATPYG